MYLVSGNSLGPSNGMPFSTTDSDNDAATSVCTERYYGVWWYNDCTEANLNGRFFNKEENENTYYMFRGQGIIWKSWRGEYYSLKRVEMKVRRV